MPADNRIYSEVDVGQVDYLFVASCCGRRRRDGIRGELVHVLHSGYPVLRDEGMRKAVPDKVPDQLDWDEANIGHVRHGGITSELVEQAVRNPHRVFPAEGRDGGENRIIMSGETDGGQPIIVIFEWPLYDRWGQEFTDWARPITAYDNPRSVK